MANPVPTVLREAALSIATLPTASYAEHHVRAEIERQLLDVPFIKLKRDRFGNLLARYRRGKGEEKPSPLCLVAHLDHPGFGIAKRQGKRTLHFLGGIREANLPGHQVEFFNLQTTAPLGSATVTATKWTKKKKWTLIDGPIPREAEFAMWKLPKGSFRGKRFVGRVCDDLAQAATMVALLRELSRKQANADLWCLFTRAEEIGFLGALASEDGGLLPPRKVPIISLECSQAKGFAQMGKGPIIRVGDRSTIFTPSVTYWMDETAHRFKIPSQRLLMAGGSCEATAFACSNREVGGICLALHHYHNMSDAGGIGAEAVHMHDWADMFELLELLATHFQHHQDMTGSSARKHNTSNLAAHLNKLKEEALATLPTNA